MNVRTLKPAELEAAGALIYQAFDRSARARGHAPPWSSESQARAQLERYREEEPGQVVVAEEGGAVVGVGAMRLRGEVATLGPIASYLEGHGIGGALVDELLRQADEAGALASRLYADAWNPAAYALYAGRGFAVVDVVAHVERAPAPGPALESARGLEVRALDPVRDVDELQRLDTKLTGHDRRQDLATMVRLVARRRGAIVGYLGIGSAQARTLLGPAVAVDPSDLFTLIAHALAAGEGEIPGMGAGQPLHARLSTATPVASMAAMGLGFRVRELGVVMSRGAPPSARPPQLYSMDPEVL